MENGPSLYRGIITLVYKNSVGCNGDDKPSSVSSSLSSGDGGCTETRDDRMCMRACVRACVCQCVPGKKILYTHTYNTEKEREKHTKILYYIKQSLCARCGI